MAGIFGWSLPPGVSARDIDRAYGSEGPCDCCGRPVDDCVCDECATCGSSGDPECLVKHGHRLSPAVIAAGWESVGAQAVRDAAERAAEAAYDAALEDVWTA